ncbi:MAG: T9SS type A sorting domain-containing protein [Segetibacter sp.]
MQLSIKINFTGNSSLWTAHTIGISHNGTFISGSEDDFVKEARNGSRWYKIGNIYTKPNVLQMGTVYDDKEPSGRRAVQYFNPTIAASGQGHSIISGTTTAYNEYLNVFAAGRYLGDELGKTKPPVKVTNTTAIYAPYYFDEYGRKNYNGSWSEYSQTVVDPLDDQTIWTFQEYANVDNSYGIRAVQFKAPPAAIGTLSNKADTTITLEGESVDNSGFFDPGKDIGGPGYNRLSVKSTGNIIVSNIKFISPTKISFTLNTATKPAGQYLLIITNPDGQLVVTDYTIAANTATIAGNNLSAAKTLRDKIAQAFITRSEVFPNPTTANTTLQINAAKEHAARIVLVNVDGKKVFERSYSFSTEKIARGTYIAAVYNADNVLIATQKIVKQ